MDHFSNFYRELDSTNSLNEKLDILVKFMSGVDDADRLYTLALLSGRRPKRVVSASLLRQWAAELGGIPDWLFEESYHTVGDLAETISLLVKQEHVSEQKSLAYWMQFLEDLNGKTELHKKDQITRAWKSMDASGRFVFNKLITGGFRVGVARKMVEKAVAKLTGLEESVVAHRLTGNWQPKDTSWDLLLLQGSEGEIQSKPYPFCLAYGLQTPPDQLGDPGNWIAEWKWDGIRGQFIVRGGEWYLWSRGEELITSQFPEFEHFASALPDGTVLDGEVVVIKNGNIQAFQQLQKRIGRKKPGRKVLQEYPAGFIVYDLLEENNRDLRDEALNIRRQRLENLLRPIESDLLRVSECIEFNSWEHLLNLRNTARDCFAEGLMIKDRSSAYRVGRKRGDWWKWKVDPMTVDAVLIYAMPGHGRRANLFTDYTFAVWDGELLVPVAKAYSGLSDEEIREVDRFVKANTIEKFGPVRSVKAELVFELGFENIQLSSRHKSGVALRFPRILRMRRDKTVKQADQLDYLKKLAKS